MNAVKKHEILWQSFPLLLSLSPLSMFLLHLDKRWMQVHSQYIIETIHFAFMSFRVYFKCNEPKWKLSDRRDTIAI